MQKSLSILMAFFIGFQVISAFGFVDEFVKRIPNDSMESLQHSLHEEVKQLNYRAENNEASQKMLHALHECLTYEVKYLESQIKNKYFFDQKALKQTASFLMIAAVSTYCTYCLYKKSIQAERAFSDIENELIYKNIKWPEYNTTCELFKYLRRYTTVSGNRFLLASGITLCSYLILLAYAHNAYTLDPNRNNDCLLKYQQLLKLVKLIQETQI